MTLARWIFWWIILALWVTWVVLRVVLWRRARAERKKRFTYFGGCAGGGKTMQQRLNAQMRLMDNWFRKAAFDSAKPLPAAERVVLTCACCGVAIRRSERYTLMEPAPCRYCGSSRRRWERWSPTIFSKLSAWWKLRRWKKRRSKLYE